MQIGSSLGQSDYYKYRNDTNYLVINNQYVHKDSIRFPYDPFNCVLRQVNFLDFAFLIKDGVEYEFLIVNIEKLKKKCLLITIKTSILDTTVWARVITFPTKKHAANNIKLGEKYKMKLIRYFEQPFIGLLHLFNVYDVMIKKTIVGIVGDFSYVFITQNLEGLKYIEHPPSQTELIDSFSQDDEFKLFIKEVVKTFSFIEDTCNLEKYFDKKAVKKTLKQYSTLYLELDERSKNIQLFECKLFNIKTKCFENWFWEVVDFFYKLPIEKNETDYHLLENNITVKLLSYNNNIYTVRVKWMLPSQYGTYYAYFSIIKNDGQYKIIGFNKEKAYYSQK
jgi:hypothetical protein